METDKPCVRLTGLKIENTGHPNCENLSLSIEEGNIATLTGKPTPCWNTLMRLISGQQPLQSGQIDLWGLPISQYSRRKLDSLVWFYSSQQQPPFSYPVYDFIMNGSETRLKPLQAPGENEKREVAQIVRQLAIENLVERNLSRLICWDRQRVLLARALMQEARLVMLDEPFKGLDDENKTKLAVLLQDLVRSNGMTILLSLDDIDLAKKVADQLILFDNQGFAGSFSKSDDHFSDEAASILADLAILRSGFQTDPLLWDVNTDCNADNNDKRDRDERLF